MTDNGYITRDLEAEDFMASRTDDRPLFGQDGDFTSLLKLKMISLAREFYDEKTSEDDNRHFKFNDKKQA